MTITIIIIISIIILSLALYGFTSLAFIIGRQSIRWSKAIDELLKQRKERKYKELK